MLRPVPLTLPPGVPPQSGSEGQDGRNRTCSFFSAEGVRNKSPHPLVMSRGALALSPSGQGRQAVGWG